MKTHYVPSGEFDAVRLLAALAAMTAASVALSAIMAIAMIEGFYLFVIVPAFAANCLSWLGRNMVLYAHVRNPWLGAAIGGFFGAMMFLGTYYGVFLFDLGFDALAYADHFPDYLFATVNNQIISHNFRPGGEPMPAFNWGIFICELGMCTCISGEAWYRVSRQPYCEVCRNWLSGVGKSVSKSQAVAVALAIDHEELETLPGFNSLEGDRPEIYGEITLCGCLHRGDESQVPLLYLTVSDVTQTKRGLKYAHRLEHREVSVEAIATLASRCPGIFG